MKILAYDFKDITNLPNFSVIIPSISHIIDLEHQEISHPFYYCVAFSQGDISLERKKKKHKKERELMHIIIIGRKTNNK